MSDMPLLGHRRPSCPPLILRGGSRWSAVQPHSVLFSSLGNRKEAAAPPGGAGGTERGPRAGGKGGPERAAGAAGRSGRVEWSRPSFLFLSVPCWSRSLSGEWFSCEGSMRGYQLSLCAPPFCFRLLGPPRSVVLSVSPLKDAGPLGTALGCWL